ncbi:MAG: type II toxin-antitoxin system RelB/DinJ family antitoxin [Candidatus Pacebacteria bacterium]|nr:type II toxin-antitoxin system RelB/DinJ family antitoxin [Candidatus Paceibacterota bacterium]
METAIINIKTDAKVKKEAQRVASDLGLTLSGAINGFLKQLIRDKAFLLTLDEGSPSKYLIDSIEESQKQRRAGDYYTFKDNKEAIEFLEGK